MGNLEYEPQSSENIALTARLVGEALGELELFEKEADEEAMEILAGMLPIQAPEGMCFRVQPLRPNYALSVFVELPDGSERIELYYANQLLTAGKFLSPNTERRPEDNLPVFEGESLEADPILIGRFVVVSANKKIRALCNPYLNSTELVYKY